MYFCTMSILRIKEIAKAKNISGKELAEKIGVTENSLSLIVNEKRQPRYETLLQIAEVLNVDIRELFKPTKTDHNHKEEIEKAIEILKNVSGSI